MNGSKKCVPLSIELTDIITPRSCSSSIAELIKYVIYNKHQIPYPFERLKMFVLKRRERQKLTNSDYDSDSSERLTILMEKYYKKVEEAFEILDSIFKCIEYELTESSEHRLEEVVLLFGATPISPKDVYRFQIPSLSYGHSDAQHLLKRQIGNLFRGIIVSDEVNANIQRKVGFTNMFVMIKLRKGKCPKSECLLPKDNYKLSERAQQVCFSFKTLSSKPCTCPVESNQFEALAQSMTSLRVSEKSVVPFDEFVQCDSDDQFVWYQTAKSLKGFRDFKSQGKSITDLWYKHRFIS